MRVAGCIWLLLLAACSGGEADRSAGAAAAASSSLSGAEARSPQTAAPIVQVASAGPAQPQPQEAAAGGAGLGAEAQELVKYCSMNVYQKGLFDCQCLGTEFQRVRDARGPSVPQDEIATIITNSAEVNPACANTEAIRQRVAGSCGGFVKDYSSAPKAIKDNAGDYCGCVANKVARDFSATPRLSGQYFETLRMTAMTECEKPDVRKQVNAGADAQ